MMTIKELAERCEIAYSTDAYKNGWGGCIKMMRKRGYNDQEIEAVIRSKWTRWAGDSDEKRGYGYHNSTTLADFLDTMGAEPGCPSVTELVDGTF